MSLNTISHKFENWKAVNKSGLWKTNDMQPLTLKLVQNKTTIETNHQKEVAYTYSINAEINEINYILKT